MDTSVIMLNACHRSNLSIFSLTMFRSITLSPLISLRFQKEISNFLLQNSRFKFHFSSVLYSINKDKVHLHKNEFNHILDTAVKLKSIPNIYTNHYFRNTLYFSYFPQGIVEDCTFTSCQGEYGGGLLSDTTKLFVMKSHFDDNLAKIGGGMYAIHSPYVHFTRNMFLTNTADYDGGVMIDTIDQINNITIDFTNFTKNKAQLWTGAIRIDHCGGTLSNCYFNRNTAKVAGAFFDFSWIPTDRNVSYSVFINNSAKARAAGATIFHLKHRSSYFHVCFIRNRCTESPNSMLIESIATEVKLNDVIFDGPEEKEIGYHFGESQFIKFNHTKFGVKIDKINKRQDLIAKEIQERALDKIH